VSVKPRKVAKSEHEQNILMALVSEGNEGHKRDLVSVLHHDGPTEPGQFGAPVVDGEGRLVGVSVASPYRGTSHAVDIDVIMARLPGLKAKPPEDPAAPPPAQPASKGWLGVSLVEVGPEKTGAGQGLAINSAQGPAAEAGLKKDDVIVGLDGQPVTSMEAFAARIGERKAGEHIKLKVVSNGQAREVEVILGSRPPR
jgi:S1-C subfamily serine protease